MGLLSTLRFDRRDGELTPPLIIHRVTDEVYARFWDQQWTYIRTNYLQKYLPEIVALGLRDFVRDYVAESGGKNGISVEINRPLLVGTNYVVACWPDENEEDFGQVKITRAANAMTVYNSGESGLPFHFLIFEKVNQSI